MTFSLSKRDLLAVVQVGLLVIVLGLLILSRPWSSGTNEPAKSITVNGQAELDIEPDEFTFYPTYNFTADTNEEVLSSVSAKSVEVIDSLKERGVEDSQITVNGSSYESWYIDDDGKVRGSLSLTIVVPTREKAQEIQDYILETSPEGSVTASPSVSREKQKQLEEDGRSAAIADARSKAERAASDTSNELGEVITITDLGSGGTSFGRPDIYTLESDLGDERASIPVQPGEQSFSYTVEVTFGVK